jgi:hypothetical protein
MISSAIIRCVAPTGIALVLLAGCSLSQSPPTCVVGQGGWFAKYTLMANQPAGACSQKRGEGLGVRKYFPAGQNPQVAIQTDTLGTMALQTPGDTNLTHRPYSIGSLTQDAPDANQICSVPSLSRAEQTVGGSNISYEWSNARFVVQPNVPGTQMIATLRYTEGGCTAEYKAVGMQPNADCFAVDGQGNPVLDPAGNQAPDDTRCGPGYFPQTQVNPDFAVRCDPEMLKCVLTADPPSLIVQ